VAGRRVEYDFKANPYVESGVAGMGDDLGDAVSKNPASEASDSGPGSENVASQAAARAAIAPLSEVERKRLQQNFQRGEQNFNRNIDYAIEMFNLCVLGDPANLIYLQSLLGAIRKKHRGKSRGGLAGVFSAGGRAKVRKLAAAEKYQEAIKAGIDTIKSNPFDHQCLLALAEVAGKLGADDTQGAYLKAALDMVPKDVEVNRQCAKFAADHGNYDQAIACWVRVKDIKGVGEEAEREISRLQVDKTIGAGRSTGGRAPVKAATTEASSGGAVDPIAVLRQAIQQDPTQVEPRLDLADLLEKQQKLDEAEKVLADALAASGNDVKVQEHIEDRQIRWAKQRVHVAEKRFADDPSDASRKTLEQLKGAALKREIDIFAARAARYPENVSWRYELATRLKAIGRFPDAIRHFQEVLKDARRKGFVALELGECFQRIKQYQLAMQNYETAIEELVDRDPEQRKRALYRAGVLATGLEDLETAQKHLSALAGIDFGYRDVAARLDKLASIGDST
jgi:tetratricopeptide (TPR) repeat protein